MDAASKWADLRDRLREVTPQTVARAFLTVAVVGGVSAIVLGTWPAFLPFIVGGLLVYVLLPVVDALDRFMPRPLAAALSVLGAVVAVLAVAALILPPLALGFVRLAVDLPTSAEIDQSVAGLQGRLGNLPEGSAAVAIPVLTALASAVRDALSGASGGLDQVVRGLIAALLSAVGALLGLIVLPTWMLTVITEKRRARVALDNRMSPWLRKDLWAVAAIADRAVGSYLRGYVIAAGLVGLLGYIGLSLSPRVGGPTFHEPLTLAVLAGVSQLVPVVGPLLGLLPALLVLPIDPARAGAYVVVYLAARILGATVLGSRLMERRLGVHPAILVPGVVMIGQFGLLWLLLSAPIVGFAVDLVRYLHGRLSEPPSPAGMLPRTGARVLLVRPAAIRQPVAYRRAAFPAPIVRSTPSRAAPRA
jgi:predicted PurR-regulated permease PerM